MRVRLRNRLPMLAILPVLAGELDGAQADPSILELHIVEGDGAAYAAGSRATRGVTVQVNDESGRPVSGATVSFTLPESGPSGVFATGARMEIASTRQDGRATVWGMRWNRTPGPFEIRITAAKGQARAGILCASYLTEGAPTDRRGGRAEPASRVSGDSMVTRQADLAAAAPLRNAPVEPSRAAIGGGTSEPDRQLRGGGRRWLWIALGAAGLAAGAVAVGQMGQQTSAAAAAAAPGGVQIGSPSVTLGRP